MANMQIFVSDGNFTHAEGVYIEEINETHVVGNGWKCEIKPNGMIWCEADAEYPEGKYSMKYTIRADGFARLTLREPGKNPKTIRKGFVVPKGTAIRGMIGLSGGPIQKRYGYFRSKSF